jgi:hypothetical protein
LRKLGLLLISVSFLAGSYLVTLDPKNVDWAFFIPVIIIGFVGIGLFRASRRKVTHSEETFKENLSIIDKSLNNIISSLKKINEEKGNTNVYDFHDKLDEMLADDISTFVEARQTISHVYNLQTYADVMSEFAGGERYVNRVWTASVDGYIDEVHEYIVKSLHQFEEAQKILLQAEGKIAN